MLILASVLIVSIEVLIIENRQNTLAITVAQATNKTGQDNDKFRKPSISKPAPQLVSA
jgi:hypothetical protein